MILLDTTLGLYLALHQPLCQQNLNSVDRCQTNGVNVPFHSDRLVWNSGRESNVGEGLQYPNNGIARFHQGEILCRAVSKIAEATR